MNHIWKLKMIYLNLNLRLPSWWERYKSIKSWHWETPFKHKHIELQVIENCNLLRLEFEFTVKQDHAGVNLELGLFGYEVHFTFYDERHWNHEKNCWEKYDTNC